MKVSMARTLPVTRKELFATLVDGTGWADWAPFVALDPTQALSRPGDAARIEYRMAGLPVRGTATVDEIAEPQLIRVHLEFPGLPLIYETVTLVASGTKATVLTIDMLTNDPETLLTATIQTLMPLLLRRDLRRMLDRLEARLLPTLRTPAAA